MARPVPFKVCIPSRGSARIGIAAHSYSHLCDVVRQKFKVSGDFCIQQEDGTIVCDEEYFKLLAPMTPLTVVEASASPHNSGNKRQAQIDPISIPPQKRPHLNIILPPYQSNVVRHHPYANPQNMWTTNTPMRPVTAPSNMTYHTPHMPSQIQYRIPPPSATPFCPVVRSRSPPLAGIVPLARNSVGHVISPPTCQHQNLFNSSNNGSPTSLVSQLKITDVMGNVNMSPSPTRPNAASTTAISGPMYHAPVRYTQAPHHRRPPYSQQLLQHTAHSFTHATPIQTQQLSPLRSTNHPPSALHQQWQQRQQLQNSQITPEQFYVNTLPPLSITNNIRQECENDLALLQKTVENLHQQKTVDNNLQPYTENSPPQETPYVNQPQVVEPSLDNRHSTTSINPSLTSSASSTLELSKPLTIEVVANSTPDNTTMENSTDPMSTVLGDKTVDEIVSEGGLVESVVNSDSESTCSVTGSESMTDSESTCSATDSVTENFVASQTESGGIEAETNLVSSQTTANSPVTEQRTREAQQTLKMLQVVTWPAESDPPFPDEDCDDEENKLCIIEQSSSPLTPRTPFHSQNNLTKQRPKPPALFHVPYINSPRPKSLGDAKYPIIIDSDSTKKSHGETQDAYSPDEGYSSSSSSPFDTAQDFTSQLPFANYDHNKTKAFNDSSSVEPPDRRSTDESPDTIEEVHAESVHGDSENEEHVEDFEEDFVMDIEVFAPLPTPNTTSEKKQPQQPLLPEYLPLEMNTQSSTADSDSDSAGIENDGPRELVVSISRDSVSSISSISSFDFGPSPAPRFRRFIRCTAVPSKRSTSSSKSVSSSTSSRHSLAENLVNRNTLNPSKSPSNSLSTTSADLDSKAPLIVSIPIVNSSKGCIRCRALDEDNSEDSDVPTTTMELLASKLERTGQRRTPQIIRLESQSCSDDEDERNHDIVATESPNVQVADYCSEINVPSVCSAKDVSNCVEELSSLCNSSPCEEEGRVSIDIGDEIELGGLSQESNRSTELTGMELLNLKAVQNHPQSKEKKEKPSLAHSIAKVYCEKNVASQNLLRQNPYWKVQSATNLTGDPRNKVQRYSLGKEIIFELSCNSGRWHLRTL